MVSTLTKLGEGAFAEVFGCQNRDKEKLALKVKSHYTRYLPLYKRTLVSLFDWHTGARVCRTLKIVVKSVSLSFSRLSQ